MRVLASFLAASLLGCGAARPHRPMQLQRVILYQNGIGYFERAGHLSGETLHLQLSRGELDDVLKTLTVIDRRGAAVATVDVPTVDADAQTIGLGVRMSAGRAHDVVVSYAVPTPTWKAAYRVVLDETDARKSLLQGWAMVNNASQEDWRDVRLTLATGAPMSFVHDLHTPQYVKRPDVNGNLVAPAVLGAIEAEQVGAADADRDGILDVEDRCPNEPEAYNGFEDDDGCPDRGRVVVNSTSIEILDQLYFAKGAEGVQAASEPMLDAVAATLRGNAEIAKLEVGGHASDDELDAWVLSSRRAASVRRALVARGVDDTRLSTVPYGATRPLDLRGTQVAREKNRRVDFRIVQRRELPDITEPTPRASSRRTPLHIDAQTAQASVRSTSKPAEVAGTVRYALSEPVTIAKGASAMVSILNTKIAADDVYLFRPDPNAPGSTRHPFRAVRLVNESGFMLEPGPIAIFARGTFVGDSLIGRLALGETAWIPYALDGATEITTTTDDDERPVRIVSIARGVATVENAGVRVTRYSIAAGREPAKLVYLRHPKLRGSTAKELPPGTQDRSDAYLIPLPLQPGKTSVFAIEERQPRRQTIRLLDAAATQLGLYVEGSHLPAELATKLQQIIAQRTELATREQALGAVRSRLADLGSRADEIRENLRALDKVRRADPLRKQLVASLTALTNEADALARKLGSETEAVAAARAKLEDSLRELTLDDSP